MARVIPDQPAAFQAIAAAIPLDWVRASSVCIAYRHMPECRSIGGAFF
jgi:hypothetical protein